MWKIMKAIIIFLTVMLLGSTVLAHSDESATMAYEVVDRETLMEFVIDSKVHLESHVDDVWDFLDHEARTEGDWNYESIYLFILNEKGLILFHGGNPCPRRREPDKT